MAGGFAIRSNESIRAIQTEVPKDLDWFKRQLALVGVAPLHILWDAQEHFNAVEPHLLELYIPLRRNFLHRDALLKAQEEFAKVSK